MPFVGRMFLVANKIHRYFVLIKSVLYIACQAAIGLTNSLIGRCKCVCVIWTVIVLTVVSLPLPQPCYTNIQKL